MKKSGFRRKTFAEIKAKKSLTPKKKKVRVVSSSCLRKKLWALCGKLNRKINTNTCYTCGEVSLEGKNWHPGHGKPKGALPLRYQYDIRNIRSQCLKCNVHRGGMTDIFISKLEKEPQGLEFLKEACRYVDGIWYIKKENLMSGSDAKIFIKQQIEEYTTLLEEG